jgi:hypothetical protein
MPTDGTLLLEHMPRGKQYMVTALSVFFSLGSVLSAIVGIFVIPGHSCLADDTDCDVDTMNTGWKRLLPCVGPTVSRTEYFILNVCLFANRCRRFRFPWGGWYSSGYTNLLGTLFMPVDTKKRSLTCERSLVSTDPNYLWICTMS